jgi:hypothetical protein
VPLEWVHPDANLQDRRSEEREIVKLNRPVKDRFEPVFLAVYCRKYEVWLEASLSIATTSMICLFLVGAAAIFSKTTNDLVIAPIEDMITKVNDIAENPLKAAHAEEERALVHDIDCDCDHGKKRSVMMETQILEGIIGKIGALLALGFGEAGSAIIA